MVKYRDEIQRERQYKRDFGKFDTYKKTNFIKKIQDYEDVKDQVEYWKNEKERMDDLVITKLNKIDSEIEAILEVLKDINNRLPSRANRNAPNSHEKIKVEESIEKDIECENKANKRGRKKKEEIVD